MASDTMITGEQVWRACLPLLAERVSPATFDGFLSSATVLDYDGEALTLGVINEFAKDWLERHHLPVLTECLTQVAERPLDLRIRVREDGQEPAVAAAVPATGEAQSPDTASAPPVAPIMPPAPAPVAPPRPPTATVSLLHDPTGELRASPLNSKYTFESFVVADCNRFAHAAALQVAKNPGQTYNPLFIHSASGLGKTHLIQAIGHCIRANRPDYKVVYISAEAFVNHMISCMRDNTIDRFRQNYRSVDVWLVDDIQFIAAIEGPASEEEFFHTFNTLQETNRQIVVA